MDNPQRLERLRSIPLPDILQACDCATDRYDPHKWHTPVGIISVTGPKFMNWTEGQGGGGAIDLVIHLRQLSFPQAVLWLNHQFSNCSWIEEPPHLLNRSSQLNLPQPCTATLHRIKDYLTKIRAIPEALVDCLLKSGSLYADKRANAVFLLLGKENRPVGAELRGTSMHQWRGMAPGSQKDLGFFSITAEKPKLIVLCESAIDAISCFVLHQHGWCISTAGARSNPLWLPPLIRRGYLIFCGFDADSVGDYHAQTMITLYPPIKRLRPPAHDWNDVLKAES